MKVFNDTMELKFFFVIFEIFKQIKIWRQLVPGVM